MRLRLVGFVVPLFLISTIAIAQADAGKTVSQKPAGKTSAARVSRAPGWKAIHNSAIVVDTHADTPMRFADEGFDPGQDAGLGHWDIAKAKQGNLGVEFFSIWVEPEKYKGQYAHRAFKEIDSVYQAVSKNPNDMVIAFSTKDIYAARRGPYKRIATLMGLEGGHAIEGDMALLRDYYRLGVRYMTLTWANSSDIGQSSGDLKKDEKTGKIIDPGLTDFGRQVVTEMNRLGMMVDVSHVSDRSFYNALTMSRAPVIASHSSARALANVPRNMTDDMLIALARNGGVAMANYNCGFLSADYDVQAQKYMDDHPQDVKRYRELHKKYLENKDAVSYREIMNLEAQIDKAVPRPPLSKLIDHIDHMVKVAGIDHVGLGSDFDGVSCLPEGINSVADLPKITQALVERGYTENQIHKILGGNLLRVFAKVEKTAQEIQHETNPDKRKEVPLPGMEPKK